jgi:RNase P/RNase MRP subunit p30
MANKNTLRKRRAGVEGYGEKRGVAINTSNNPDRKSPKRNFKMKDRPVQAISLDSDDAPRVQDEKIKKKDS